MYYFMPFSLYVELYVNMIIRFYHYTISNVRRSQKPASNANLKFLTGVVAKSRSISFESRIKDCELCHKIVSNVFCFSNSLCIFFQTKFFANRKQFNHSVLSCCPRILCKSSFLLNFSLDWS